VWSDDQDTGLWNYRLLQQKIVQLFLTDQIIVTFVLLEFEPGSTPWSQHKMEHLPEARARWNLACQPGRCSFSYLYWLGLSVAYQAGHL